jgi:DNA-binding response OmpR family regulator
MNILLVEDDIDLQRVLAQYLELSGYKVITANHGKHGLEKYHSNHIDIGIFDIMMPVMDGFDLAQKIRRFDPFIPIIFLTAKNQKEDKIRGLKIGADDYITKPFEVEELVLRIKNILRRSGKDEPEVTFIGNLEIRFDELIIKDPMTEHQLTRKEGDLLKYLIKNKNRVLKREEILTELWGQDDYFMGRSMDVFISRIRKYLSTEKSIMLDTIRGIGFILKDYSQD